jgi:hypothetical protein
LGDNVFWTVGTFQAGRGIEAFDIKLTGYSHDDARAFLERIVTIRPPEYKPPPGRAYTDLGWVCAALTGPATFVAVWIYCAATYGFLIGFFLGWIPAVILALLVAVAMIYLWPLAAIALLYLIYRVFGVYPALPTYIAIIIAIFAIATVWWWHMVRDR